MTTSELRLAYAAALKSMAAGHLDEAVTQMEQLIQQSPDFLEVYEGLAMVYSRKGDQDKAISLMELLAQKDPSNPMAHTNLSVFYMKKGMKEKAEEEKAKAMVLQFGRHSKDDKSS